MRIRKLAKDMETDELALMELLRGLGHVRYTDPEQQLPGAIEAQVRRHARSLPKLAPPTVLPTPRARPVEPAEPDLALFEKAMATVRPIGAQPKPTRPPPAPAPRLAAPAAPVAVLEAPRGRVPEVGVPRRPGAPATAPIPLSTRPATVAPQPPPAAARPPDATAKVELLEARLAEQEARIASLEARLAEQRARTLASEAGAAEAEARSVTTAAALAELQRQPPAAEVRAAEPSGTATLRACFEARGLLGEDEMAATLRAILDGHRVAELLRIEVADPARLEDLLWERVLLLAEDEPPPPGVVAVRVSSERSEGRQSSANRAAMSRFSTACLLHNVKRIVIVGGSPAYHRTLREGLDPRLDVRLIPGNRRGRIPAVPSADLVILWASTILDHSVSAQFPDGVVVPHRSIARMLGAVTEWIEHH